MSQTQRNNNSYDGFTLVRGAKSRSGSRTTRSPTNNNTSSYASKVGNNTQQEERTEQGNNRNIKELLAQRRKDILSKVASGNIEVEYAERLINRTYTNSFLRFRLRVTINGAVAVAGLYPSEPTREVVLYKDDWARFVAYMNGQNYQNFISSNESRLKDRLRRRNNNNNEQQNQQNSSDDDVIDQSDE